VRSTCRIPSLGARRQRARARAGRPRRRAAARPRAAHRPAAAAVDAAYFSSLHAESPFGRTGSAVDLRPFPLRLEAPFRDWPPLMR
jgi:hypothetical protein